MHETCLLHDTEPNVNVYIDEGRWLSAWECWCQCLNKLNEGYASPVSLHTTIRLRCDAQVEGKQHVLGMAVTVGTQGRHGLRQHGVTGNQTVTWWTITYLRHCHRYERNQNDSPT
jgi:hypothetical protein